jgi:lycopene cyclase domain-containing protein
VDGKALMPLYPALALLAAALVVVAELAWFRSGIFRTRAYYLSMLIIVGFMIAVDGWLTKLSAPIVLYNDEQTSAIRPVWDILLEEYAYAFALVTMVILLWDRSGQRNSA